MKKPADIEHQWTWDKAVENCNKNGTRGKKSYVTEYERLMLKHHLPRKTFDKKLLCFKTKKGDKWEYLKTTSDMIKKETPERDILFRTVKLVMKEDTETFADVLRFRVDWLVQDSKGHWGTEESIEETLKVCKLNLSLIDDELVEMGFKQVGLVDRLVEEDRRSNQEKSLSDKLLSIGLQLSDDRQLSLFSENDSLDS
mgnify:FL=1